MAHNDGPINVLAQAIDVRSPAIATDQAGKIVEVNRPASDMFAASGQTPVTIQDIFVPRVHGFIRRLGEIVMFGSGPSRADVVLPQVNDLVNLRVSVAQVTGGDPDGAMLVWQMWPVDARAGIDYEQATWLQFLADASMALHSSLDPDETFRSVVSTCVPFMADWCSIDLLSAGDSYVRRVAVFHVDPERARAVYALRRRYPATRSEQHPVVDVVRAGRAHLIATLSEEYVRALKRDDEYVEFIGSLDLTSIMIVPLRSNEGTIGAMTFSTAESGRVYTEGDLERAQTYADMAGQAISNARTHQNAVQVSSIREHYLSVASHEIRTPLAVIGGFTTLLIRQFDNPAPNRAMIDNLTQELQRGVDRLEALTEDLLVASTVQRTSHLENVQEVDLVELLRNVVDRMSIANPGANGKISLRGVDLVEGFWNPELLERAFSNLIGNAVKYSPNSIDIAVDVREDEDGYASVDITDAGIGISEDDLDTLFMPFMRGANARKTTSGTGLGLYITLQIIEQHRGTLDVQSELGAGSTFSVRLPLKQQALRQT